MLWSVWRKVWMKNSMFYFIHNSIVAFLWSSEYCLCFYLFVCSMIWGFSLFFRVGIHVCFDLLLKDKIGDVFVIELGFLLTKELFKLTEYRLVFALLFVKNYLNLKSFQNFTNNMLINSKSISSCFT